MSQPKRKPAKKIMYYANEFNYYTIKEGRRIFCHYTSCRLYKSKEEAENNAQQEWLRLAEDGEILEESNTKLMVLWTE